MGGAARRGPASGPEPDVGRGPGGPGDRGGPGGAGGPGGPGGAGGPGAPGGPRNPPGPRPHRGEIWLVSLNPRKGREQKGTRPCLVVSTDAMNESAFGTVIVCPITTTERPAFRWRPGLTPADLRVADRDWTPRPHWVATDQIVTVDAGRRALRLLATVANPERLREVDDSLRMLLDL